MFHWKQKPCASLFLAPWDVLVELRAFRVGCTSLVVGASEAFFVGGVFGGGRHFFLRQQAFKQKQNVLTWHVLTTWWGSMQYRFFCVFFWAQFILRSFFKIYYARTKTLDFVMEFGFRFAVSWRRKIPGKTRVDFFFKTVSRRASPLVLQSTLMTCVPRRHLFLR